MVFTKSHKGNVISFATDLDEFLSFNIHEDSFRTKYWNVQPNDIVMDIGVDYGPYTLTALSQGAGHVYAVEPDKYAIARLVENLRLNKLFMDKTTVIMKAVSDTSDGRLTITVDNLIKIYKINRLDWIKIDVEGMENKVLLGARNTLTRYKPKIILENHSKTNEKFNDTLLGKMGYELIYRNKELLSNVFSNHNSQSVYYHYFE